jgi:hypothetical protein
MAFSLAVNFDCALDLAKVLSIFSNHPKPMQVATRELPP